MDHHQQQNIHGARQPQQQRHQQQLRAVQVSPPVSPVAPFRSQAIRQQTQLRAVPPLLLLSPPSLHQQQQHPQRHGVSSLPSLNKPQQRRQQQPPSALCSANTEDHTGMESQSTTQAPSTATVSNREAMVGTIPTLPGFHILERTAQKLQLPLSEQIVTLESLLHRIFTFLRSNSIVVKCVKDTGCLDCNASSAGGDDVEFVIQLWRVEDSNDSLWLEVQRRGGCSLIMNLTRRNLFRFIKTGDPASAATRGISTSRSMQQLDHDGLQRRPLTRPRPVMTRMPWDMEPSESERKRSRVMPLSSPSLSSSEQPRPPVAPKLSPSDRMDCGQSSNDSLVIALSLLESPLWDQQRLGLESLVLISKKSTTSSPEVAMTTARCLVVGDGPLGARLQQRMVQLMHQFKSPSQVEGGQFFPLNSFGCEHPQQSKLYHLTLQVLTNALECLLLQDETVAADASLSPPFWQTIVPSLTQDLENAMALPHEAALSAKCIHYLLQLTHRRRNNRPTSNHHDHHHHPQMQGGGSDDSDNIVTNILRDTRSVQIIAQRAYQYGKENHLALEQGAQQLLGSCNGLRA